MVIVKEKYCWNHSEPKCFFQLSMVLNQILSIFPDSKQNPWPLGKAPWPFPDLWNKPEFVLCIPKEVSDYHLLFIFPSLGGKEEDGVRLKFPPLLTKVPTTKNQKYSNCKQQGILNKVGFIKKFSLYGRQVTSSKTGKTEQNELFSAVRHIKLLLQGRSENWAKVW